MSRHRKARDTRPWNRLLPRKARETGAGLHSHRFELYDTEGRGNHWCLVVPPVNRASHAQGRKRVYYLSLEFLIGRLFADVVENLRMTETVKAALRALGGA